MTEMKEKHPLVFFDFSPVLHLCTAASSSTDTSRLKKTMSAAIVLG